MNGMRTLIRPTPDSAHSNNDLLSGTAYAQLDEVYVEPEVPQIDHRFVERRENVARAAFRVRSRKQLGAAAGVLILFAGAAIWKSGLCNVRAVDVVGVSHTNADAVRRAANLHGDSMLTIDEATVRARLARLPYIASVSVRRHFPNRVELRVRELSPVAVVEAGGGFALVGNNGRVLERVATAPAGLVVVRGAAAMPAVGSTMLPLGIGTVAEALPQSVRNAIEYIDVADQSGTVLHLGSIEIRVGRLDDVSKKLRTAEAVLRSAEPCTKYVDVSVLGAPVSGC